MNIEEFNIIANSQRDSSPQEKREAIYKLWKDGVEKGEYKNYKELAEALGVKEWYVEAAVIAGERKARKQSKD